MKSVDAYIDALPEEKAKLVERIRSILLSTVPGIEERFSFKIPFYHYYGMFCYINVSKKGIDLTFCRGRDLLDLYPQLESRNRAIAASLVISSEKDIVLMALQEVVATAAAWNREAKELNRPMVAKKRKSSRRF